jgi:hypothetical protein
MVAAVIAASYVVAAFALEKSWPFAATVTAGVLVPLALIWFPEFCGGLTGWGMRTRVDQPSPTKSIAATGWLFLLGLPVLVYFLASNH